MTEFLPKPGRAKAMRHGAWCHTTNSRVPPGEVGRGLHKLADVVPGYKRAKGFSVVAPLTPRFRRPEGAQKKPGLAPPVGECHNRNNALRKRPNAVPARAYALEAAMPAGHSSRRVLLIEDNPDGRETLRMVLELWGHRVEVAEDGLEGVHKALTWRPETAIVDIGLPGLDGYEVARRLRRELVPEPVLLAVTGHNEEEDRRRSQEAGFDSHLVKPLDLDKLTELLATLPVSGGSIPKGA